MKLGGKRPRKVSVKRQDSKAQLLTGEGDGKVSRGALATAGISNETIDCWKWSVEAL